MKTASITLTLLAALAAIGAAGQASEPGALKIRGFETIQPLCRAGRLVQIKAIIENRQDNPATIAASLSLPKGLHLITAGTQRIRIEDRDEKQLVWQLKADSPGEYTLALRAKAGAFSANQSLRVSFLPAAPVIPESSVKPPKPVQTEIQVGAMTCPLWEADHPEMWANILKHPERTPALGFYAQENPEVADWETRWATEHGISFFVYCWYRNGQGGPVKQNFGSAIHRGLYHSKYRSKMHYAIMWENQSRGQAGVSDEKDLFENLFPYWLENYFKDPLYQRIDGKPVLYIYRPEFLVQDLGSEANVRRAMDTMRQKCADAGLKGLYILGEYRGLDPLVFAQFTRLGMDASFPYCLSAPDKATPDQIIDAQFKYDFQASVLGILPKITTVSQAWSGWQDEGPLWKLPPTGFETLLRKAKDLVKAQPANSLASRMLLLDNWNEWGEGHYIAPYREYGFGYLDAVRNVFAPTAGAHTDLLPEDVVTHRPPVDAPYRAELAKTEALKHAGSRRVVNPGGNEPGLIGWWGFDEPAGSQVAIDGSGHRLGGVLRRIARSPQGKSGGALLCDGGCVLVAPSPLLNPENGLSLECWVKANKSGQGNNWMVNRVLSGGTSTGFRLGVLNDCPCFEIPLTDFSHHLTSNTPLTAGKWVHICGTFDNQTMRLYVDGELKGEMERPGPVHTNEFNLCIGNYTEGHSAYFHGLLDDVKLYNRPLSADEVKKHAGAK